MATAIFGSMAPPDAAKAAALASEMPWVADKPLEAPHFHKTNWRVGQRFKDADDPDRTSEPWMPPSFALEEDPATRLSETVAEELRVPKARPNSRFATVVRHVLTEAQCATLLASVNAKGFTPALLNVGMGVQMLKPDFRDGHRVVVDSPELAAWLLEVLRPHLPEQLEDGSRLVELNERLRFLCYTAGQSFEEHTDGRYRRPSGHPRAGDQSRVTIQVYLHDIPEAFGGATTFYPSTSNPVAHQPEAGSVVLFTQDLLHEGSLVMKGLKYTLRTEAMYTRNADALLAPKWAPCAPSGASCASGSTDAPDCEDSKNGDEA